MVERMRAGEGDRGISESAKSVASTTVYINRS
jgi:hypothetical protein